MANVDNLYALLKPTVEGMGFELWGIEFIARGANSLLRIYIDNEEGITVDHCEAVSRQVSAVLDVEDPIGGQYNLELSSPGLDRILFFPEQYRHYCESQIALRLHSPVNGQKKFKGKLLSVNETDIHIEADGKEVTIPFDAIDKANVIPSF